MSTENLSRLIALLERIREKMTDEADVLWTPYDSPAELRAELDEDLGALRGKDLSPLARLKFHFMAASTFQDIALNNGWGDEFILLAKEFDQLYAALQTGRAPQTP